MMKKLTLLTTLLFMTVCASAQLRIGARGAVQINDMRATSNDPATSVSTKSLLGYNLGVAFDYSFNNVFFFQPNLLLNARGSKQSFTILNTEVTTKSQPSYLDVQMPLGFRVGVENVKIYAMAGPYIGFGLAGKNSVTLEDAQGNVISESSSKIKWGDESTLFAPKDLRRIDMGLTFGAGVELGAAQIGIYYTPGLVNIAPDNSFGKLYNTNFGINFTFFVFGDKD